ncbi:flagellar export protein FliJ [Anaerocolumna sp. AGMB13025]|uniref:flagellar export protein FliJ n=1 Tax=Anaerocolumna sp. AGMB13025 TaxID=3039116 RepID=UPI00241EE64A|nr:flagellar export protein FliJ [Anaerocolumna sp. AGMB13025]WFR54979.1 flagellar export protein FliJ [Anaerocolumna sp. AGMB13025]
MTKFVYKMENILSIKYKMEDQAKTAYGLARMKLSEEEEKLTALKNKVTMYQERKRNLVQSKLKLFDICKCEEAIDIVKHHISLQQLAVKKAEKQLENARIRLNVTMMERKTHEKLKENALTNYFIEYEAEERKEIDELVSFKYNNPADN